MRDRRMWATRVHWCFVILNFFAYAHVVFQVSYPSKKRPDEWLNDNETVMSKDDEHESPWFHSRHLSEFHCVVWVGWLRFFPRMIDYDSIERFVSMHVKPGCIDYWPLNLSLVSPLKFAFPSWVYNEPEENRVVFGIGTSSSSLCHYATSQSNILRPVMLLI